MRQQNKSDEIESSPKKETFGIINALFWDTVAASALIIAFAFLSFLIQILTKHGPMPEEDKKVLHFLHFGTTIVYMGTLALKTLLRIIKL